MKAARQLGVRDERVLAALRDVRRELYVHPADRDSAYRNAPIPTEHGQVTTQPSLVARMVEGLQLRGTERVLEIGTGPGYQAAILGQLAREVYSVERYADLAREAEENLRIGQATNVKVFTGDGSLGLPQFAPFDAIIVAAAATEVPAPLVAQLAERGRLVQPVGPGGDEVVKAFEKRNGALRPVADLTGAFFVRLVGKYGARTPRT